MSNLVAGKRAGTSPPDSLPSDVVPIEATYEKELKGFSLKEHEVLLRIEQVMLAILNELVLANDNTFRGINLASERNEEGYDLLSNRNRR